MRFSDKENSLRQLPTLSEIPLLTASTINDREKIWWYLTYINKKQTHKRNNEGNEAIS